VFDSNGSEIRGDVNAVLGSTHLVIIAYTTIDEARNKGIIWPSPCSYNIWFNPGGAFGRVTVFIPFGKKDHAETLTDTISYVEWSWRGGAHSLSFDRLRRIWRARRFLNQLLRSSRHAIIRVNGPHWPAVVGMSLDRRFLKVCFIEAFWEQIAAKQDWASKRRLRLLYGWYRVVYRSFDRYCGTPSINPEFYASRGLRENRICDWTHEVDLECLREQSLVAELPHSLQALTRPWIVTVGRLHEEKLSQDAFDVFIRIKEKYDRASLIFVGDGPLARDLTDQAQSKSISDSVVITGMVHQAVGYRIVRESDLYLATMQGNALVEAIESGCRIVAYSNDWHRNLVEQAKSTAVLVADRDKGAMAEAACHLLASPVESSIEEPTHDVHPFSTAQVVRRLLDPYLRDPEFERKRRPR
jgi:glycosyltransferase involved in cell wall biosynthesis